jgi:aryl-alcohol dehydrogenase-like predicted oxidoreductase
MGLGLAAIGRPAYVTLGRSRDLGEDRSPERLRVRAHELLDAAYAAGVRYLDVARSYGLAEDFLAAWLAARPDVTDVTIGSKWGYTYVGGWRLDAEVHEVKEHSAAAFARQLAQSRDLLGPRLSVYYVQDRKSVV